MPRFMKWYNVHHVAAPHSKFNLQASYMSEILFDCSNWHVLVLTALYWTCFYLRCEEKDTRLLTRKMEAKKCRAWQKKLRLGHHGNSLLYKKSMIRCLVRQVRTDLTYARLHSLLPQCHQKQGEVSNGFTRTKSDILRKDVEERKQIQSSICTEAVKTVESLSGKESFPTVKMEQHELNISIRISTVRSFCGPQAELFEILEEQDLDILHAQGIYSEDTVFHSILVKVVALSEFDMELLSERLYKWAGNTDQLSS